jgi:hypothetical protein
MPTIVTSNYPTRIAKESDRGTYRGVIGVVHCSRVRYAVLGWLAVYENVVGGWVIAIHAMIIPTASRTLRPG